MSWIAIFYLLNLFFLEPLKIGGSSNLVLSLVDYLISWLIDIYGDNEEDLEEDNSRDLEDWFL